MTLDVSEIFFSVNGEGLLIGAPSIFIRLSKCNLRCSWCDTQYAWDVGKKVLEKDIIATVTSLHPCQWIVITGGEPLLQNINALIDQLQKNFPSKICIETNGTLYKEVLKKCDFISVDIKPPSSGNCTTDLELLNTIINVIKINAGQLKAVIADKADYRFVYKFVTKYSVDIPVILQPCYQKMEYNTLYTIYKKNPLPVQHIRILPQIHKLGGIK